MSKLAIFCVGVFVGLALAEVKPQKCGCKPEPKPVEWLQVEKPVLVDKKTGMTLRVE